MQEQIDYIVEKISQKNPLHGKKIRRNIKKQDAAFFARAEKFFDKYLAILSRDGQTIDYSIDCYLQMIADVNFESIHFLNTGEYTSKSFEEVNKRVYDNPDVMTYYMHALLMSQFLWVHHYEILLYFNSIIKKNSTNIKRYLEIGGGHGLYISEAISILPSSTTFDVVDISKSSIEIATKMVNNDRVTFTLKDVFEYFPNENFDFITMGEVLEHVEDPVNLLKKLHSLLKHDGRAFITTPTNAPAIDHIYLFKNADDIRSVIKSAGFEIADELCVYSEDVPKEIAEQYKISMMYIGVLKK